MISHATAKSLTILVIIGMVVQLGVIAYVGYNNYKGRQDIVSSQRQGCERGKLDRTDNADFQVAHTIYIGKVTNAASVKADVKRAANTALKTFRRTSADLAARAKIVCATVFPKARLIP